MSYLSKSKWMSLRSATAATSLGAGRLVGVAVGAGVVVVPPLVVPLLLVGPPPLEGWAAAVVAPGVVAAAPVGEGAAAWVVAGRFAQPTSTTPRPGTKASLTLEQRRSMFPPF